MYPAPAPPQPYWGPPPGSPYQPALPYAPGQYEGVLYGELTADGQQIVLIAEGSDWGLKEIGKRLGRMTPLLESPLDEHGNKIRGPLLCPCTWPAVVQLGFSFNSLTGYAWVPSQRLTDWIAAEAARRLVPPPQLNPEVYPPWLKPRDYQVENARAIAAAGKFILMDEPGTGKTVSAIMGIEQRRLLGIEVFPLVIVVPSWEVGQSWREHIAEWAPGWGTPRMHKGDNRVKVITAKTRHLYQRDVFITTYATARRDALPDDKGPLCKLRAATVVADECVPHDTLIETPGGARPIRTIQSGDLVLGVDHETGNRAWTEVRQVMRSPLRPTVEVAGVRLTPEHPIWISDQGCFCYAGISRVPRVHRFGPESVQEHGSRDTGEKSRGYGEPGLAPVAGRQRHGAYYPAGDVARSAGQSLGAGAGNPDRDAERFWLPASVQGGPGAPGPENSGRGAREGSRQDREPAGPEETGAAGVPGLDSAVDLERADPDRSLWNLETGTGNYFAYGVLVHNCHLITNQHAHQTAAVQRIAQHAATFLAASGTFVTRNAKDAYPVLEAMDRRSFPAGERYTARYCKTSGADYENETIDGLDPLAEPELRAVLAGQMHRFAKADVLDQLPPKIYSVRRPEIPAEWRSAYDQMEQLWLAELPDGDVELSAMDTLTRLTRLSQLASSAADVRIEYVWDERAGAEVPKQIVTLRAPSWKAESLTGILAERPDQPTAVFTESRPLALITGQYCEKAGLRTGYIVGKSSGPEDDAYGPGYRITDATRQAARDGFQAGKLDVIICTAGAGGTGITLTAANCAVMLQRSWQYDLGIQVEDRIHRIGAEIHAHVEIIDIVAQGTVDERRREILREKAGHAAEWAQDPRLVRQILGGLK